MESRAAAYNSASTVLIDSRTPWIPLDFRELLRYRELLLIFVWRDIKVRYKQTALGIAWAVLQPLFLMLVFTLFVGRAAKFQTPGVPYALFVLCGLLPWQLFNHAVSESTNSLVANERLITKVYFPRVIIPLASVVSGLVDFGVSFVLLAGMMLYYHVRPSATVWMLPLFLLLALVSGLAVGIWLSTLCVEYRDVRYTIPYFLQFGLLATPIAYPASLIPARWHVLYALNPMAGVVEGFRWVLLNQPRPGGLLLVSTLSVVVILVGGLFYFRRMEDTFADVI